MLITKYDLPAYVKFSTNIADNLINPAIRDAHEFDVLPLLNAAEETALTTYKQIAPDDLAELLAIAAAGDPDAPGYPLAVLTQAVHVLYTSAVRPLLCYETYRRFLLDHGVHITPNGAETISDAGHQPITGQQRTEMRNDAAAKCAFYRARLAASLRAYRGPAAATSCTSPQRRPGAGGLNTSAV